MRLSTRKWKELPRWTLYQRDLFFWLCAAVCFGSTWLDHHALGGSSPNAWQQGAKQNGDRKYVCKNDCKGENAMKCLECGKLNCLTVLEKIIDFLPQIIHFKRVFHYFHHPFGGTSAGHRTSQLQGPKMRPSDTTQGQLENLPTRWSWGREAIRWWSWLNKPLWMWQSWLRLFTPICHLCTSIMLFVICNFVWRREWWSCGIK